MKLYLKFLNENFINKNYDKFDGNCVMSSNNPVYTFSSIYYA